jgi:hypothetical protein
MDGVSHMRAAGQWCRGRSVRLKDLDVKDFPKIKLPPAIIESESKTPVQFLPSTMLSWRAPIIVRRNPAELLPETPRDACGVAR